MFKIKKINLFFLGKLLFIWKCHNLHRPLLRGILAEISQSGLQLEGLTNHGFVAAANFPSDLQKQVN